MLSTLKKLGPGLLFAGAAIGVSHLVQSTRAGATFGLGLIWALLLVNLFKYPFFQFGPRYASATGESLLEGYKKLGKPVLIAYLVLTFATMFTIQTAVTIVTAGLALTLFGPIFSLEVWTIIILAICLFILLVGKYQLLDKLIKIVIILLSISTIIALFFSLKNNTNIWDFTQILPTDSESIIFLIAFMGWMPAPLDISIWHSLWAIEKQKKPGNITTKNSLADFNIGYLGTLILGVCFLLLGFSVMYNSGEIFSDRAGTFSNQLINMYTSNLGSWAAIIIGLAALTTMFSTTITTLDASPRALLKTTQLLFNKSFTKGYLFWVFTLTIGTIIIFFFFASNMGDLIKIATIISFMTAPFYAIINYILVSGKYMPKQWRPSVGLHILSVLGIVFLIGFSIWYIMILLK